MTMSLWNLFSLANIPLSPETAQDQERRIRREIANSNERRRMQSINAGFQSLKTLLPHTDGEKLSKVPRPHRHRQDVLLSSCCYGKSTRSGLIFLNICWICRQPFCSRRQSTSLPWSRRRLSSWHRTTSWNASSRSVWLFLFIYFFNWWYVT